MFSNKANITNRQVLLELDYIERTVDENGQTEKGGAGVVPSDGGVTDNVVWSFSISTLIKELHSTNSRVYDAIISNSDMTLAGQVCRVPKTVRTPRLLPNFWLLI